MSNYKIEIQAAQTYYFLLISHICDVYLPDKRSVASYLPLSLRTNNTVVPDNCLLCPECCIPGESRNHANSLQHCSEQYYSLILSTALISAIVAFLT